MATFDRLSSVAPELAAALRGANDEAARRTAFAYARRAVESSRLDSWVRAMLAGLESGAPPSSLEIDRLSKLVDSLDEVAWDINERSDGAGGETYLRAFSDARAAAAVLAAAALDARGDVVEVAYEAWAAGVSLEDLVELQPR
ncbi:hypothetical protein GCM10022197_28500 [Microlunatus spumicola]|uniref:Uncharacterized protein n=1 Tax=Microlunatus spumicola TaxID=81499 RepID=A0ABP6XR23_9ACTN